MCHGACQFVGSISDKAYIISGEWDNVAHVLLVVVFLNTCITGQCWRSRYM